MDPQTEAIPPLWEPPSPKVRRRRPVVRSIVASVVVLVLVGGGIGAFVLLSGDDGPHHPDQWDPRLEEFVAFVEHERGLEFRHPVEARFLTEAEFVEQVEGEAGEPTDEEKEEIADDTALWRAIGLVEGDLDLVEAITQLHSETTLAYYDPETKQIVVRGDELDVSTRVTVVHELTHALQDQHFDLEQKLEDDDSFAFTGLIEGDATVIEERYLQSLGESEISDYDDSQTAFGDDIDLGDVPEVFLAFQSAPYALGPGLVSALLDDGDRERLDEAFREPPASDTHLLDPTTFIRGEEPDLLETPELEPGEKRLEHDEDENFGAIGWYLFLAERIDAHTALRAVDGLGGDSGIAFRRDGQVCGRLAFSGVTDEDTDEMADALEAWVKEMPEGVAETEREGDVVMLTSCDPGTDAKVTTGRAVDAFTLPVARSAIYRSLMVEASLASEAAWCSAVGLVEEFSVETLLSDEDPTPEEEEIITEVVLACMRA